MAAFFRIANSAGTDDRLLKVTLSGADGDTTLSRHRMTSGRAAHAETVGSADPSRRQPCQVPSGLM
ncbi:hypothetical protein ACWCQ0_36500 [Streptomyces massasporeus]|uniref:Uncharacterized protein n=1 Tax=Streptomyces massasporeus TaxID=67324 RepID=A0ABW6LK82_9ACTN